MKTPQEEAEAMARRIAITLFGGEPNSEIGKQIVDRESKEILDVSALAELIAVARAADIILTDYMAYFVDWERMANDKTYKPEYPDNVLKAQAALQALRATGKVEGI